MRAFSAFELQEKLKSIDQPLWDCVFPSIELTEGLIFNDLNELLRAKCKSYHENKLNTPGR